MAEYIARVSARGGKKLHTTEPHPTRDAAAKAAFQARPNARSVSTSIAHNGQEAHRDIRWHDRNETMKQPVEESRQSPNKGNNMRRSKIVREGIAKLLEDVMAKSTNVMALQGIVDQLQGYAEDLSTVEAKKIMPMYDSMRTAFGAPVADRVNTTATEQIRQLIAAVQGAKSALDHEIHGMEQGVEGHDMSDMAMDTPDPAMDSPAMDEPPMDAPPGAPVPPAEGGEMPEIPAEDDAVDGGFAGRPRKESAQPRGKLMKETWRARLKARRANLKEDGNVREDFLGGKEGDRRGTTPAIDQHPHKSINFDANVSNLAHFHGGAGKLARNIESMIDSDPLTGDERTSLANVLSHFAGFAQEPSHWANAEAKLKMTLQGAGIWDASKPAVDKIVVQLRRLAHLIAFKHEGMIENAIKELKNSPDPDGLVVRTFRMKLAETRDAQTAAIRTSRTFGIDIEDVVTLVREAALDRDRYGAKAVKEAVKKEDKDCAVCKGTGKVKGKKCFKCSGTGKAKEAVKEAPIPDNFKKAAEKKADDKTEGDKKKSQKPWEKESVKEAPIPDNFKKFIKKTDDGDKKPDDKKKSQKPWEKKEEVTEDDEIPQNATMFPVQANGPNTAPNPGISNPGMNANPGPNGQAAAGPSNQSTSAVGGPNANSSTNKPMTPMDMRVRQQAQAAANTPSNGQQPGNVPPTGSATVVPPGEKEQGGKPPSSTQPRMAPSNPVKKPAFSFQSQ